MTVSDNNDPPDNICEDCGALEWEGRAGCLKMFEGILAREFSDYRNGRLHRLTVDADSLQHPDKYMRSDKSFAARLTGLSAAFGLKTPCPLIRRYRSG